MELAVDNGGRLERRVYLFEYGGIQFKLVQEHPREHADHLLTVLPSDNEDEQQRAYEAASLFLACLCWQNRVPTALWEAAGGGWPDNWHLRRAKPRMLTFPRIPFGGYLVGCSLSILPKIENERQRLALAIFREAQASNSDYLSLLFYWHVLDIAGVPKDVANRILAEGRIFVDPKDLARLPLRGRSLGEYLEDDCRHAIAHIERWPGKQKIEIESIEDRRRIALSARIAGELARRCIEAELELTRSVYLVRTPDSSIPVYLDEKEIERAGIEFNLAYPKKYGTLSFPSPRGGRASRTGSTVR